MKINTSLFVLIALAPLGAAFSQEKGCIELQTLAQTEVRSVGPDGQPVVKLVPAATVVPGTEVIWTVSAKNICDKPAGDVSIDSPIPEHSNYIADSATGPDFAITFSLDGKRYGIPVSLTVKDADGTTRPARADEYRHVRYQLRTALAPGQSVSAHYRTSVQ